MGHLKQVHVIDRDSRRRAQISSAFACSALRTQIYEDLGEFKRFAPSSGFVLLNGDGEDNLLPGIRAFFGDSGCYMPIAMYSSNPPTEKVVNAILSGALDYLEWPFEPERVFSALERMALQSELIAQTEIRRANARLVLDRLSSREREVLTRMINGFSNKATAEDLGISPRTVEIHRSNLIKKLRVDSTVEAVRLGLYAGLDVS